METPIGKNSAETFFLVAQLLPEGSKTKKVFPTKKEANAFRIRLYRLRQRLGDYSIAISMEENVIFLTKEIQQFEVTNISPDGIEEKVTLSFTNKKEEEKEKTTTPHNHKNIELSELVELFNMGVALIEKQNEDTMIRKQELRRHRTAVFGDLDNDFLSKNVFISRTPEGLMSFAHLRTEEEKLNVSC